MIFIYSQCHTGILGGGHYVAYAKNTRDQWFCFNDSSCKVEIIHAMPLLLF